ncbi:two-component system OmpR family response regulator [Bradyrhizobium japonicum]
MVAQTGDIIVVDDDCFMREILTDYLRDNNLCAKGASSRSELAPLIRGRDASLIVLDVKLGEDDGLDVLRDIRSRSDVPIIMITGCRAGEADRIVALELGADDYLLKPFSPREMLARIRALLRRNELGRIGRNRAAQRGGYRFNGWCLERRSRKLVDPNGAAVPLSNGEYSLLLAFLEAPQRPLSREHLLHSTRMHEDVSDRSIDVQILRLRRKLASDPRAPHVIRTERQVGYLFASPVERF